MKSLSVKLGVILFIIGFAIIGYAKVWGAENYQRASLQGLKGIYVLIDGQFDDLIREGLTKDQLKTDVELQLRKARIKVLTEQEFETMPESPHLSITVSSSKGAIGVSGSYSKTTFYAIGLLIQLHQDVILIRNPKMKISGVTWKTILTGWHEAKDVKNSVRENLKDGIDIFMNDYLTANPK